MHSKKLFAVIIALITVLISTATFANGPWQYKKKYPQQRRVQPIYVCELAPFAEQYRAAGYSESSARYAVKRECQIARGNNSIFCETKRAQCRLVPLYR